MEYKEVDPEYEPGRYRVNFKTGDFVSLYIDGKYFAWIEFTEKGPAVGVLPVSDEYLFNS